MYVVNHTNWLNDKSYIVVSMDAEKLIKSHKPSWVQEIAGL